MRYQVEADVTATRAVFHVIDTEAKDGARVVATYACREEAAKHVAGMNRNHRARPRRSKP